MALSSGKLILSGFVGLIVAVGLGFGWGAAGRHELGTALDQAKQQLDLAEARGQILDARVSLYNNNFGDASRRLEEAKAPLRRIRERYQSDRNRDAAAGVDAAMGQLDEAQRLSSKLDPAANSKAADALEALRVAAAK